MGSKGLTSAYLVRVVKLLVILSLILVPILLNVERRDFSSLPLGLPSEEEASAFLEFHFNKDSYRAGEVGYVDVWVRDSNSNISIVWFGIHFDWMEEVGKSAFHKVAFNESLFVKRGGKEYLGRVYFSVDCTSPGNHSFFFWIELWREEEGSWYEEIWRTPESKVLVEG